MNIVKRSQEHTGSPAPCQCKEVNMYNRYELNINQPALIANLKTFLVVAYNSHLQDLLLLDSDKVALLPERITPEYQANDFHSMEVAKEVVMKLKERGSHSYPWTLKRADGTLVNLTLNAKIINGGKYIMSVIAPPPAGCFAIGI